MLFCPKFQAALNGGSQFTKSVTDSGAYWQSFRVTFRIAAYVED